jgi:predicted ATPase
VHWADEATLDLLRFLGRRIRRTTALLILTYRDDEIGAQHPLRSVLGDMATSPGVRRINLAPLSLEAVRALAAGNALDAAALHRQTAGNPFFVTEVLAGGSSGLPVTVRDAVLARVARLSPAARAVMEAAAVVGARAEASVLAGVSAFEAAAIDECLTSGMLMAQATSLAFRNELARQAILEAISPPHRLALHHRVLAALRSAPATADDLARLAHHAEATGDRDAVLAYAPAAARQAAAARAHREAAALLALALRFAAGLPPADHALLLEAYATESNLIDQRAEGLAARQQALALWGDAGNTLKQGECLAHMAFLLNGLGQTPEAEQVCAAALHLLEAHPPGPELALAYRVQAGLHMLTQNYRPAIEWGEKAIALAERFADTRLVLAARNTIGTCWMFLDYAYGCQYLEQNLATAHTAGEEALAAHAYANLSSLASELYHFSDARHYTLEGSAYAAERGLDHFRLYMLAWQAITQVRQSHWPAAAETAAIVLQRPAAATQTPRWC